MQNLATKRPVLRAGTNKRAQAIPVDIVWGISGQTTPRLKNLLGGVGDKCSGNFFSPFALPVALVSLRVGTRRLLSSNLHSNRA